MVTTCGSRLIGGIPMHIRAGIVEYNKVNALDLVHCWRGYVENANITIRQNELSKVAH